MRPEADSPLHEEDSGYLDVGGEFTTVTFTVSNFLLLIR